MKKILIATLVIVCMLLTACGGENDAQEPALTIIQSDGVTPLTGIAAGFAFAFYQDVDNDKFAEIMAAEPEDKVALIVEMYSPLEDYFATTEVFENFVANASLYDYRKKCWEMNAAPSIDQFGVEDDGTIADVKLTVNYHTEDELTEDLRLQITFDNDGKIESVFFYNR